MTDVVAACRDASWYSYPSTNRPVKYHVDVGDHFAACNGAPLVEQTERLAAEVHVFQRCQRPGCRVRWPTG